MDFRDKYNLESDIECLQAEGKIVLARTVTTKGWTIFWYDKSGYTVTTTARSYRGVGAALPFIEARQRYFEAIGDLL